MKPFKLNSTTYFLPESWQEVTLEQFQRYHATQKDAKLGQLEKAGKILNIFSEAPLTDVEEAGAELMFRLFERLNFLKEEVTSEPVAHFLFNGATYYVNSLEKFGELAAYDRVVGHFKGDMIAASGYILAILCRKKGEVFTNDKNALTEQAKRFEKGLDAQTVMSLIAFFLSSAQESRTVSQFSLRAEAARQKLRELLAATSMSGTDGSQPPSIWRRLFCKLTLFLISHSKGS
ncbi:hypothetical protein ACFST9_04170 [Hymenobacter monticola]|uniref:Uncharacterized protein n=1 Tax=Hymenobacter monticola TaxID=1705399 RepID=A0ABY4B1I5_9BACT|nr:hypothetical protein [Hymenobacter monticola]UOE32850.1 hypothetical protein MTP16_17150 [Hymenobacter monticola]